MFIYHVHRTNAAGAARAEHGGGRFETERRAARIKGSVHERQQPAGRVRVIHRRSEHETVRAACQLRKLVYTVVNNTFARFCAAAASGAILYGIVADKV